MGELDYHTLPSSDSTVQQLKIADHGPGKDCRSDKELGVGGLQAFGLTPQMLPLCPHLYLITHMAVQQLFEVPSS